MAGPTAKKPDSEHVSVPRPRRKKHGGDHQEASMAHDESNWLVSYADMMTLLFGFFVLLYSFSKIDGNKFEVIRKDLVKYFGGQVKQNPGVRKTEQEIQDVIAEMGAEKSLIAVAHDSEIEIRFLGSLHFNPGTATLNKESAFILAKLIDSIKRNIKADSVTVDGHTDDDPVSGRVFPSNWELSAARASSVVREFEKYGFDPSKLTARGFGSSHPIAPNRDSKGEPIPVNQEVNRRVIVTIGFSRQVEDAIRALKTGEFISADNPESAPEHTKGPLLHDGEGEPTWREKVSSDLAAVQDKLKLAEERLKDTEERNRAAKQLADLQNRLKQTEARIDRSEAETKKYFDLTRGISGGGTKRAPASKPKPLKAKKAPRRPASKKK